MSSVSVERVGGRMATFIITCRTMAWTPGCTHQHVASVGYYNEKTPTKRESKTRKEMIALLRVPGNEAFTRAADGTTARVVIHTCNGTVEYLTTLRDSTRINNLDELRDCSRKSKYQIGNTMLDSPIAGIVGAT